MQCRVIKNGSRKEKMSYKKRTSGINTADKRSAGCCCSHTKAHLQGTLKLHKGHRNR